MPKKINIYEKDYYAVNLLVQYGADYTGTEKYIIFSNLTKEKLFEKYGEKLKDYEPFLMMSLESVVAFVEFSRNEHKHEMRSYREISIDDENFSNQNIRTESAEETVFQNNQADMINAALDKLKEIQRDRLVKHIFKGKTYQEIADEEKVTVKAVYASVENAKINLKKFLRKG